MTKMTPDSNLRLSDLRAKTSQEANPVQPCKSTCMLRQVEQSSASQARQGAEEAGPKAEKSPRRTRSPAVVHRQAEDPDDRGPEGLIFG